MSSRITDYGPFLGAPIMSGTGLRRIPLLKYKDGRVYEVKEIPASHNLRQKVYVPHDNHFHEHIEADVEPIAKSGSIKTVPRKQIGYAFSRTR